MKNILLLLGVFFAFSAASQAKTGFCKVNKTVSDTTKRSRLTFKFLTPEGKPAKSHVAFKIDNGDWIQPKIDNTGTYSMVVDPGTHSFLFYVKYWHDVISKPLVFKPKTNTFLTVKFEPEEIRISR